MPGISRSATTQPGISESCCARNSWADENVRTTKPAARTRRANDLSTPGSSSTMDTVNSRSVFGVATMSGRYGLISSVVARRSPARRDTAKFDGLIVMVIVSRPAIIFLDAGRLGRVRQASPPRNGSGDLYDGVAVRRRELTPHPDTESAHCRRTVWLKTRSRRQRLLAHAPSSREMP